MKVKLLKPARIHHEAGEIVEISPAEYVFLMSVNGCEPVAAEAPETPEKEEKKNRKRK